MAVAATVGQSIKMAETMTRLDSSAGRLIPRLLHLALRRSALVRVSLYYIQLLIKALSVALH